MPVSYNSSGSNTDLATFDDFSVATVPEPSSFTVLVGATLLLCIRDFCDVRTRKRPA